MKLEDLEKHRMTEWLNRSSVQISKLRRKPKPSKEEALALIRENYQIIQVLVMVLEGNAHMIGIAPPNI
jgi:hypothetical protein